MVKLELCSFGYLLVGIISKMMVFRIYSITSTIRFMKPELTRFRGSSFTAYGVITVPVKFDKVDSCL